MHRFIRLPLAGAACLLVFGCQSDSVSPQQDGPMYAVSDGAHDGNPDFFFLPPLFKNPSTDPNYEPAASNPNLKPAVEICELGPPAADLSRQCIAGPPLKRFDPSVVTYSDQQYQVNWKTDERPLDVTKFYRINVLVGTALLGFADVDPVSSGKDLKNVQTNEYIPLLDGRTLPIKFRIESGALCAVDGTPCASETVNLATGGSVELLGGGEDFKFDIPSGTTATFGDQPVSDVTFNLEVCSGIDVDLPKLGACLRVSTYFNATGGTGELVFSNPILISLCVLNQEVHTPDETRQEQLVTLHQQDGAVIRALPHVSPNCNTISTSFWNRVKNLAARVFEPRAAIAASRSAALDVGGGGSTDRTGATCPPAGSAIVPRGMFLIGTCPPSSPALRTSGPQRSPTATITPAHTVSDFQFALPAMMDFVDPDDASRSAAAGTMLPTAVKVTDWDGNAVQGANVTFFEPAIEGPPTILGTATSNSDGIAQLSWTIRAGSNTAVATGRGIAAQNNYPDATVKPFMPDISLPTGQQEGVFLGNGRVTFLALGTTGLTGYRVITSDAVVTAGEFDRDAVQCPAGTVVVGGGAQVAGEGTADFNTKLRESAPGSVGSGTSARDVWLISIKNDDASPHTIRKFAVCADAPAGYEVVTSADFTLTTGGGFHREAIQCSAGKSVLSGGAQVVGEGSGNFYVKLQESAPGTVGTLEGTRDVWLVSMKNEDEVSHTARIYAVCASSLSGYEVNASNAFSLAADGGFNRQSVLCSGTKAVTGGGAQVVGEGSADFGTRLQESAPGVVNLPAQDVWLTALKNEDGNAHNAKDFAVCVDAVRVP